MITDFTIISGATVPSNYSWDSGLPSTTVSDPVTSSIPVTVITGYAPKLTVLFQNNSTSDPDFKLVNYDWNFGDYYNSSSNAVSLSCTKSVEHTFIMPGTYTVTLVHTQSQEAYNPLFNYTSCRGKYNKQWYWNAVACNKPDTLTWDQTKQNAEYAKWWSDEFLCFQKHCKIWSWYELQSASVASNPIRWEQTQNAGPNAVYPKKWAFQANDTVCTAYPNAEFLNTINAATKTITKTSIVNVIELPPTAELYSVTVPVTGVSPYTVQLTPRTSKAGSFPIDRIDWNFGDGTKTVTVSRYTAPDPAIFTHTNSLSADTSDPRNYDAVYTYRRTLSSYPVFYPSITAYHSSTNTSDRCSTTVGPISLSAISPEQIYLIKSYSTPSGKLYGLQVGDNVTFVTPNTASNASYSDLNTNVNVPPNKIKNILNTSVLYPGNSGGNYPVPYTPPACNI